MIYQPKIPPVAELLKQEESISLEFKSDGIIFDVDRLTQVVTAIANTAGGLLVIGVDDQTRKPQKEKFAEKEINSIVNICRFKCKPGVSVSVDKDSIDSKEVLVVVIPRFMYHPHRASDDKYYIRAGKSTQLTTEQDVAALFAAPGYYLQGLAEALKEEIKGNISYAKEIVDVVINDSKRVGSGKQYGLTPFSTYAWQAVISKGEIGIFGVSEITSLMTECYRKIERVNGLITIQMMHNGRYEIFDTEMKGSTIVNEVIFKEVQNLLNKLKELGGKLDVK